MRESSYWHVQRNRSQKCSLRQLSLQIWNIHQSLSCLREKALSDCSLVCVVLMLSQGRVWQQVWSMNNFCGLLEIRHGRTQLHTHSLSIKYHKIICMTECNELPEIYTAECFSTEMFDLHCRVTCDLTTLLRYSTAEEGLRTLWDSMTREASCVHYWDV